MSLAEPISTESTPTDPTPPGKVGMWLFIASEIMFFVGIVGAYIVLANQNHALFVKMAATLNKPSAILNTFVLISSSLTMTLAVRAARKRDRAMLLRTLAITLLCGCAFLAIKSREYREKWLHNTIVARETLSPTSAVYVYDGHVQSEDADSVALLGYRDHAEALVPARVDIHLISPRDVQEAHEGPEHELLLRIDKSLIAGRTNYFPWKNIFFGCYFTLTAVHALHLLGGIIAVSVLLIQALRGKLLPNHTECIALYWHFVDVVWIFLFSLLYLA